MQDIHRTAVVTALRAADPGLTGHQRALCVVQRAQGIGAQHLRFQRERHSGQVPFRRGKLDAPEAVIVQLLRQRVRSAPRFIKRTDGRTVLFVDIIIARGFKRRIFQRHKLRAEMIVEIAVQRFAGQPFRRSQ